MRSARAGQPVALVRRLELQSRVVEHEAAGGAPATGARPPGGGASRHPTGPAPVRRHRRCGLLGPSGRPAASAAGGCAGRASGSSAPCSVKRAQDAEAWLWSRPRNPTGSDLEAIAVILASWEERSARCSTSISSWPTAWPPPTETEPRLAIQEVMRRAFERPGGDPATLPSTCAEIVPLHSSPRPHGPEGGLGARHAVPPHNHLMWAASGSTAGRRTTLLPADRDALDDLRAAGSSTRVTSPCSATTPSTAVHNPRARFAGAIHVYGGDLPGRPGPQRVGRGTGGARSTSTPHGATSRRPMPTLAAVT